MRAFWRTAAACALAAGAGGAAAAQDTAGAAADEAVLPTLNVEADGAPAGAFGPTFEASASAAMRADTPILETPRSVSVVTQQQMQDRGARNLSQALQYTPGVFAGTGGNDNRGDWLKVRGFDPMILLDGMQSFFGYYNNVSPEPFLLEEVAVLKGPSGMLYGNGAVGGIVNEVSKLPNPAAPNLVQIELGTDSLFQSNIDMGGALGDGRMLYRLVGLGRSADGPVRFGKDDAAAFMPSLTWLPNEATTITLLGLWQKNDATPNIQFLSPYGTLRSAAPFANGRFLPNDVFVGEPSFNKWDGERQAVTLFADHEINAVWSLSGRLRYTASTLDYDQGYWAFDNPETGRYNPDGSINRWLEYARNDSHSWIGDLHANADFAWGETGHEVMFGAAFTDGDFTYNDGYALQRGPIDPFDPDYTGVTGRSGIVDGPRFTMKQQSLYAQDRVSWGAWRLDLGLRYDWIEQDAQTWDPADPTRALDDGELSPSFALLYASEIGLAPYVSYSESFFQENVGLDVNGDPFDPTEGKQWEAGIKYQPPGTAMLFTAAAFEITKSNTVISDPNNPAEQIQTGEAKARGFELDAQGGWRGFTFDAGYAYLDTEAENGDEFPGIPEHQASAWLQYAFGGALSGLEAGAGVRYVGSTVNEGVETPSVTLYDAMIGYSWDRYLIQVTGRNLADKTYVVDCGFWTCYYGDPRTVALSLTATF